MSFWQIQLSIYYRAVKVAVLLMWSVETRTTSVVSVRFLNSFVGVEYSTFNILKDEHQQRRKIVNGQTRSRCTIEKKC
jgi:hypothetical protein